MPLEQMAGTEVMGRMNMVDGKGPPDPKITRHPVLAQAQAQQELGPALANIEVLVGKSEACRDVGAVFSDDTNGL